MTATATTTGGIARVITATVAHMGGVAVHTVGAVIRDTAVGAARTVGAVIQGTAGVATRRPAPVVPNPHLRPPLARSRADTCVSANNWLIGGSDSRMSQLLISHPSDQ